MHSEELSMQYLDTVKKDSQDDSLNQGIGNYHRSQGCGHGHAHGFNGNLTVASETQVVPSQEDLVTIVVPSTLQSSVQLSENPASPVRRKAISSNFVIPACTHNPHSASLGKKKMSWWCMNSYFHLILNMIQST